MVTQEEVNTHFGEIIRFLKREGYSQAYICEKADLGQNTISRIMNGHNNAGDDVINKLCKAFKLNYDYFYGQSEHMTREQAAWANVETEFASVAHLPLSIPSDVAQDNPNPAPFIPTWADSLIDIMTQQIKQNEALNRELRQSISDMHLLTSEVTTALSDLTRIIKKLT